MMMPRTITAVSLLLIIIGGLNWLLVGLFEFDLVAAITGDDFGETNWLSRAIYIVVGLAALIQLSHLLEVLGAGRSHRA